MINTPTDTSEYDESFALISVINAYWDRNIISFEPSYLDINSEYTIPTVIDELEFDAWIAVIQDIKLNNKPGSKIYIGVNNNRSIHYPIRLIKTINVETLVINNVVYDGNNIIDLNSLTSIPFSNYTGDLASL